MSGSSLDGVDLACCTFERKDGKWAFSIIRAETIPYGEEWKMILSELPAMSALQLVEYDISYGIFLAEAVNRFLDKYQLEPDLIASHGHTIFHAPDKGYTFQLGHGQTIAQFTGLKTISDFRIKDIQLGGQGAPLVPIGDSLLFSEYDFCLNIGGIANISYDVDGNRMALDVCPANQLLNHLSLQMGKPFDENGHFARLGKLNLPLFDKLNSEPFFKMKSPKSLSNQYVQSVFIEMLEAQNCAVEDKLYTVVKHIAFQVNEAVKHLPGGKILITGGGAHNRFLTDAISMETKKEVVIPDREIVDFKEALIFAFMGVLRNLGEINCLASATGAQKDCSGGTVFLP
jgi:anhydro-N-acetylmuramic acid kinase